MFSTFYLVVIQTNFMELILLPESLYRYHDCNLELFFFCFSKEARSLLSFQYKTRGGM